MNKCLPIIIASATVLGLVYLCLHHKAKEDKAFKDSFDDQASKAPEACDCDYA